MADKVGPPQPPPLTSPRRLDSWKEIAGYLKRDVRTVQRWETREGLPVHRASQGKRAPVFAYAEELDTWWRSRAESLKQEEPQARSFWGQRYWLLGSALVGLLGILIVLMGIPEVWLRSWTGRAANPRTLLEATPGCEAPPGLLAAWFGEGNAQDSAGKNHGEIRRGAGFAPGIRGQAFALDGENAEVLTPLRRLPEEFTVTTWILLAGLTHAPGANKAGAPVGDMSIVDKMASEPGPNRKGWRLFKQHDNLIWFCVGGGATNGCGTPTTTVFSRKQVGTHAWYQIAAVRTPYAISLYLNGRLEDTRMLRAGTAYAESDVPVRIGGSEREGAHFNGLIDQVGVFSRALSADEIKSLFQAGASGACGSAMPPDATVTGH